VVLLYYRKNFISFITNSILVILLSILPIIILKTSISILPSNNALGVTLVLIWILFLFFVYYFFNKFYKATLKTIKYIFTKKILTALSLIITTIGVLIFIKYSGLSDFSNEFLTDNKLIFNFELYKYMLLEQFKKYMNNYIFYLGGIGLFILFFTKKNIYKVITIAFLIGSLTYWIAASKVIFFHRYYTLIFMLLFSLASSIFIIFLSNIFKKTYS
jgi:hypothetical protein